MKKLSKNQQALLDHLRDGWELRSSSATSSGHIRLWLQKPNLVCGGKSINVHANTVRSLINSGILERFSKEGDRWWLHRYRIAK